MSSHLRHESLRLFTTVTAVLALLPAATRAQTTTTYKGLTIAFHQNFAVGTIPRPTTASGAL
jgi:hypothetical protein